MTLLVTIGPTQEPLDAMRILSNRSTGELGTRLAVTLAQAGHRVIALRGTGATAEKAPLSAHGIQVTPFTTTEDLRTLLKQTSKSENIDAIFHAAAVSDFYFPGAGFGKIPSNSPSLTLTLEPTPKLLSLLRDWFPQAMLIGWKFEASGNKETALAAARTQIVQNQTDACVLNGPSYGEGFGVLYPDGNLIHQEDKAKLCSFLTESMV